jgi:phospholipase D1/2
VSRLQARERARLEIVIILNPKPEALKEELAIGLRQAQILRRIAQVAAETGHALGVYGTLSDGEAPDRPSTYIHSKLLIVDDRFLTVGSANLTNRSMGVDTELHASWESTDASEGDPQLGECIQALRVSLLAEHAGLADAGPGTGSVDLARVEGLVARLDGLTSQPNARLTRHVMASPGEKIVLSLINPEVIPFDPSEPDYADGAEDEPPSRSWFMSGVQALRQKLSSS